MLGRMQVGDTPRPPSAGPSRPSRRALAIAATVALAVIAGSIAAAVFLSRHTPSPGIGEGTTSPSASATTSATPSKSEASPTESVVPYPADAALLQVVVPGLRMRASASTGAEVLRTLNPGEVVRVASGPVEADGYAWYEVIDLDSRAGWAAMGAAAAPWLIPVPSDPAGSPLVLRFERACDAVDLGTFPVPDVTLSADGRVILFSGVVRHLSPSGLAQVQRDALELPSLQASADYRLEVRPGAQNVPAHGVCGNRFTLGEGNARVVVTTVNWQGDEEEGTYYLPAPERHALDQLAMHLQQVEAWLGPSGWSDSAGRYVSSSYRLSVSRSGDVAPAEVLAPSVSGAGWPFSGPIEQFGGLVGQERCGYLDLRQAFETLRVMRAYGVPSFAIGEDPPPELPLDGFGYGNFSTGAGWFSFGLTPRTPDGFPACPDAP